MGHPVVVMPDDIVYVSDDGGGTGVLEMMLRYGRVGSFKIPGVAVVQLQRAVLPGHHDPPAAHGCVDAELTVIKAEGDPVGLAKAGELLTLPLQLVAHRGAAAAPPVTGPAGLRDGVEGADILLSDPPDNGAMGKVVCASFRTAVDHGNSSFPYVPSIQRYMYEKTD